MGVAVAGRKLDQAKPVAMGIEPHGLGVDGHAGTKRQVGGKVAAMKADRHLPDASQTLHGAQEKTRTSTPLGAST